ncbi:MAG: hypothetical protein PUC30_12205 [Lachnospiraceae bacterium]|nr:hypothetical protein [Lachnospiraceae bacterium]
MEKPTRCISPCMKLCQECKYGWIKYPDWVETYEDTFDCCFESGCIYGLEDTEPNEQDMKEFEDYILSIYGKY